MYIFFQPTKGKSKLVYLQEGYRDIHKKPRIRILQKLGRLSDFQEMYPHLNEEEIKQLLSEKYVAKAKIPIVIDLDEETNTITNDKFNYGHLFLDQSFNKLMNGLAISNDDLRKLNHLVSLRIIEPCSKRKSFKLLENFIGYSNDNYKVNRYYDLLTVIAKEKDNILQIVNKNIGERDFSLTFYDTTNYYFETPYVEEHDIRQKGFSKENRPNPIVQMGLLMDKNNIPIHYKLFKGNTNDSQTFIPIFKEYRELYNIPKIILVADAGVNSAINLDFTNDTNNGYVMRLAINKKSPKSIKDIVLDTKDYTWNHDKTTKSKTTIIERKIEIKENDKYIKTITLKEKLVITFNQKYYERDKKEHEKLRGKLTPYIEGRNPENTIKKGYTKYFDSDKEDKAQYIFNEKKFDDELKYAGYYALVTSELDFTTEEIIEKYKGLLKIEESFKVIKSDLEGRPVYVWKNDHIEAHFLICFISLVMIKLLQRNLNKAGHNYTTTNIKDALKQASAINTGKGIYLITRQTPLIRELIDIFGLNNILTKKWITEETIKKIILQTTEK